MEPLVLLARLRRLGLPDDELGLYFHLDRMGASTPAMLGRALQLAPAALDDVLRRLMEKGLVQSTFDHQLTFEAVPLVADDI
jgi:sugar-specific transcriptional regulator TrmB